MPPLEKNRCFECSRCLMWERVKAAHCDEVNALPAGEEYDRLVSEWELTEAENDKGLFLPCSQSEEGYTLGRMDRGLGHYNYAVLKGEDVYVECGDDEEKAYTIMTALNRFVGVEEK